MPLNIDNLHPVPKVKRDSPTGIPDAAPAVASRVAGTPSPSPSTALASSTGEPRKAAASMDAVLAGAQRAVTNRVAGGLWDTLTARAGDLGVPIRQVLTDAIVRALEQPLDEHTARVHETRRREALAKIDRMA